MTSARSITFESDDGVAVRIPRGIALESGVEVEVVQSGDVLTIYPIRKGNGALLAERLGALPGTGERMERPPVDMPDRNWG